MLKEENEKETFIKNAQKFHRGENDIFNAMLQSGIDQDDDSRKIYKLAETLAMNIISGCFFAKCKDCRVEFLDNWISKLKEGIKKAEEEFKNGN